MKFLSSFILWLKYTAKTAVLLTLTVKFKDWGWLGQDPFIGRTQVAVAAEHGSKSNSLRLQFAICAGKAIWSN